MTQKAEEARVAPQPAYRPQASRAGEALRAIGAMR
jgi:hypothetical protein